MSVVTKKRRENSQKARAVYQSQVVSRAEQVIRYWDDHSGEVTLSDLSVKFGVSERTARRYLNSAGRELPPQKRRQTDIEKVRLAHRLFAEHGNKAKVSRLMGMSSKQVSRYLQMPVEKVEG